MAEIKLDADSRTEFGKGAARRLRRDGKIPAVLYEHGMSPIHVALPGHATMLALKQANALFEITVDGDTHLGVPRQVQRDPLRGDIEHVDLLIVKKGERIVVEVPVVHIGTPGPDTLLVTELDVVSVEAEATNIPNEIEVSVEGLEAGSQIHTGDLALPSGVTLADADDLLLFNIVVAPTIAAEDLEVEGDVDAADVPEVGEDASAEASEEE